MVNISEMTALVRFSLESRVSENRDSQEQRRDPTTKIGDNSQDLLIIRVHRSPGDILETKTHTPLLGVSLLQ